MGRKQVRFGVFSGILVSVAIILLGRSLLPAAAVPSSAVEFLSGRNYVDAAVEEIGNAKSSVTVCMYVFTLRPDAKRSVGMRLAEALVAAKDRGVTVEVILDQNDPNLASEERTVFYSTGINSPAYSYLKERGVAVYYDDAATDTYAKALVIDGETVIFGSSNWTEAAFYRNREVNGLLRDKAFAAEVLASLADIPRRKVAENIAPDVLIPGVFLWDPELAGKMVGLHDERAFETYLYLLRQGERISLDYKAMARALGLAAMGDAAARRQINKTLTKLETDYHLIRARRIYGENAEVEITEKGGGRPVRAPAAFWDLGWPRNLGLAGKWFYLVSQYESEESKLRPRWSAARSTLAARYHVSPRIVSEGVVELRRRNLLDVQYDVIKEGEQMLPAIYIPAAPYDSADLARKLEELKALHGAEKLARAQKAAAAVYEDSDPDAMAQLIALESEFGPERVADAVRIIEQKNPDNPLRTLPSLIEIIRNQTPVPNGPGTNK